MFKDKLLFDVETVQFGEGNYEVIMPEHAFLAEQRKALGLSQQMVATTAGIQLRQYQRLESGERSMCSASLRIGLAICDVLQLDPHRFVPTHPAIQTDPADGHKYIRMEAKQKSGMKKYKVFRSLGDIDEHIKKHELVAVEYGRDIHAVTDKLIQRVNEDAEGLPQYERGYSFSCMAPEEISSLQKVKRYQYSMTAIIEPDYAAENILIDYGIIEEEMSELVDTE